MQIFLDHIFYIALTLGLGVLIGWQTYPLYRRLIDRITGTDRTS